jgi:hypothetical protein
MMKGVVLWDVTSCDSYKSRYFGGTYRLHHQGDKIRRARNNVSSVRFEVFTAVTMKNGVFWDVTPCGSCKNRRFGGTWRLLHQGDKNR